MNTLLDRLQDGKKRLVTRADYETFLDLLPPVCFNMVYQGERWDFGFAAGAENIRLFKKHGENFYAVETPYLNPYEVGGIEMQKRRWVMRWLDIGRHNRALRRACEPLFTIQSFQECATDQELLGKLRRRCWPLGQAFFVGNICFVNLANDRQEWLVIKEDTLLDDVSFTDLISAGGIADALKVIEDIRRYRIIHLRQSEELAQ